MQSTLWLSCTQKGLVVCLNKALPCNLKRDLVFVFGNQQVNKLHTEVQDCHLVATSQDNKMEEKEVSLFMEKSPIGKMTVYKGLWSEFLSSSVDTKTELNIPESFKFASKCSMLICTMIMMFIMIMMFYYYFLRFYLSPMEGSLWKRHWLVKLISGLTKWI